MALIVVAGGLSTQEHTAVIEILKEERRPPVTPEIAAEFYRLHSYSKNLILTLA